MTANLLVLAFAIVFPGAIFLWTWDFVGRVEARSKTSLLGLGAALGFLPYTLLEAAGVIQVSSVLRDGKPALDLMLTANNLGLFASLSLAMFFVGLLVARVSFSRSGSGLAQLLLDRTLAGSNWIECVGGALDQWVNVKTKAGLEWSGLLELVPDRSLGGFVRLRDPKYFDSTAERWLSGPPSVVIPVEQLLFLLQLTQSPSEASRPRPRRTRWSVRRTLSLFRTGLGSASSRKASTNSKTPKENSDGKRN